MERPILPRRSCVRIWMTATWGQRIGDTVALLLRLALRSARSNWRRFVLTTIAIVVGTSFVVGSFVLTDSLSKSINSLIDRATGNTDLVIGSADSGGRGGGGGGFGGSGRTSVDATLTDQIRAVPGVDAADPTIIGIAQVLDKAGQADAFDVSGLTNWPDHPDMFALRLVSGRAPTGPDDIVIDRASAKKRSLDIGSTVRLGTKRGIVSATISGFAERGAGDLGAAGQIVAVSTPRAVELVGTDGRVTAISVRLSPGADITAVQTQIATLGGDLVKVQQSDVLLADARQRINDRLANFTNVMLGFAALTLFVSGFLIWNTFSMVIAQRRREFALLRAVGARSGQIIRSVIAEAVIVGAVASGFGIAIGVLLAIGLRKLLTALTFELPGNELVIAPRTILVAVFVGVIVTVISVIVPAWRTTRIAPTEALRTSAVPPQRTGRISAIIGLLLVAFGVAWGWIALVDSTALSDDRATRLALAAGVMFVGVVILSRFGVGFVVAAIGYPFRRLGIATALGRQNTSRDPRRTASTATALAIGIALVATSLILGESVKSAFGGSLRASITADMVISSGGIVPFDDDTIARIAATPGVTSVAALRTGRVNMIREGADAVVPPSSGNGGSTDNGNGPGNRVRMGFTVMDPGIVDSPSGSTSIDPDLTSGSLPTDASGVAVSVTFRDEQKLTIGSPVRLRSNGVDRVVTVTGVFARDEIVDDALLRPAAIEGFGGVEFQRELIMVRGSSTPAVLTALAKTTSQIPNSAVFTADGYVTDQTSALDIVLGIVSVLLLFAIVVAALGIANTLALSVVERTRELGLLRVVGMNRWTVRRMIVVEGVLVATVGGLIGLTIGVGFGAGLVSVLPASTAQMAVPFVRLALLLALSSILGIVSSILPALRASRINVLQAVSEE